MKPESGQPESSVISADTSGLSPYPVSIAVINSPVPSSSDPYLVLKTESGGRHLSLVGHRYWTVGRSDDNTFVLPDRWISRNHAMLQGMENGGFYLIDLGSRNGTYVNGRRVSVPVVLQDGDLLTFGQTELLFFGPSETPLQNSLPAKSNPSQELTATATLHVRRLISVMVVDIRDFTVMTQQIDEKLLSEAIGTWFRRAGEIISQYQSWVDKYIGDAIMAVWIHDPDGPSQADVSRLLQAVSALAEMTGQLHEQFPLPFPLRIRAGLNTGYAIVGNTGSGDRPDYTALGDTVNAAFRLESSTKQLGVDIAIGETTYGYLRKPGTQESILQQHTIQMKGYDHPITTYAGTFGDLSRLLDQLEKRKP